MFFVLFAFVIFEIISVTEAVLHGAVDNGECILKKFFLTQSMLYLLYTELKSVRIFIILSTYMRTSAGVVPTRETVSTDG